jgi:hypothetical protein
VRARVLVQALVPARVQALVPEPEPARVQAQVLARAPALGRAPERARDPGWVPSAKYFRTPLRAAGSLSRRTQGTTFGTD